MGYRSGMTTGAIEGLEYSERPGFTLIGGHPTKVGPVIVRIDGSRQSFAAVRTAVGHAMTRICGMIILDDTRQTGEAPVFIDINEREQSVADGILQNNHVTVLPVSMPGLAGVVGVGEELEASLLVLSPDDVETAAASPALLARLINAPFDVLLLAPGTDS